MKTYEGVDVQIEVFFISAIFGSEWSAYNAERAPGSIWIGG
jgi:hypothetical protein